MCASSAIHTGRCAGWRPRWPAIPSGGCSSTNPASRRPVFRSRRPARSIGSARTRLTGKRCWRPSSWGRSRCRPQIDIPVRILLGTESAAYFRPAAEAIARHVQQTEFVDLVGQEHKGIDRDPEQLVAKILDFTL